MRKSLWVWFAGCAAWIIDGFVSLRLDNHLNARLAFCVATIFLAAALFYRQQQR